MRLVKAFVSVNAVAELMVYEKRTCTTCKNLALLLRERGIDFERVDYHVEPVYEELGLAERQPDDDEAIRLMAEHPELMQRPVVVRGDRAVLARPVERVLELLDR